MEYFKVGKILENDMGLSNDTIQIVYEFIGNNWYFEQDKELKNLNIYKSVYLSNIKYAKEINNMFTIFAE